MSRLVSCDTFRYGGKDFSLIPMSPSHAFCSTLFLKLSDKQPKAPLTKRLSQTTSKLENSSRMTASSLKGMG
jgi:hypothetical protein